LKIAAKDTGQLKAARKAVAKRILLKDLPEQDRFQQLRAERKHFLDTIKVIAYRTENSSGPACSRHRHTDDRRHCHAGRFQVFPEIAISAYGFA
jgi:hypothetical protein